MRQPHHFLVPHIFLCASILLLAHASGTAAIAHGRLLPSEQWVLERLRSGKDANFENYGDEIDPFVTSCFLEDLLTGKRWIIPNLHIVYISNATITGTFDLRNAEIPYSTFLENCTFAGDVWLNLARFKSALTFNNSTFQGNAEFRHLVVGASFEANGVRFEDDKTTLHFGSMRASNVLMNNATFSGPVEFEGIEVRDIYATGAHFLSDASFDLMKATGQVVFDSSGKQPAVFDGSASFYAIETGSFMANTAQFNKAANFELMEVKRHALFEKAVFKGAARFYGANIGANFQVSDATFESNADFERMIIGGYALFRPTTFNSRAGFRNVTVGSVFETAGSTFKGNADFSHLQAGGVSFSGTKFLSKIFFPDMKYEQISFPGTAEDVISMIERSDSSQGAFVELEKYYQRTGNISKADEMYIAQRRVERASLPAPKRFGSWLVDLMTGYGRQNWRASVPAVVLVLFGWLVFFRTRESMQPQNPQDKWRHYNGLLYSLDLFLPIVNLQSADIWIPNQDRSWARNYVPLHTIAGWVLATILAATLTGILK